LDANNATLTAELRKQNVGSIAFHDLSDFIQPIEEDVVDLAGRYHDILDEDLDAHDQLMKPRLGLGNLFLGFTGDVDFVFAPTVSTGRRVAEYAREGRWEIDCGVCGSFDEFDVSSSPAADKSMHGEFEFQDVNLASELEGR
jgi:hypothetical protein